MSSEAWVAFGALGGAIIGAAAGTIGTVLVSRAETSRARLQLAIEAGLKHWEVHTNQLREDAKKLSPMGQFAIYPPTSYIDLNARIVELLAKGQLTAENLRKHYEEHGRINRLIKELS